MSTDPKKPQDFQQFASQMLSGGKSEAIRKLAASEDGRRVGALVGDGDAVRRAVAQGDTEALRRLLGSVLASEEGARLAKQLSALFGER